MAILEPDIITNTELFMMESASLFHFGVLTSVMHMAWVRQVCGRLKSDYRYSAGLVYNNRGRRLSVRNNAPPWSPPRKKS